LTMFLFVVDPKWRVLWGSALVVLLAGTLASLSRGALVGLAGMVVWGMAARRVSTVALLGAAMITASILVVAFAFFGPVLEQRIVGRERITGVSAAARTAFWGAAVRMSVSRPLVGVGPERFDAEREKYLRNSPISLEGKASEHSRGAVHSVHDSYLEIAAEDGVPAALVFVYFLFAIWCSLRDFLVHRANRVDGQGRLLASALQGALIVAVLSGIFVSGELEPAFWFVAAFVGGLTLGSVPHVPRVAGRRWMERSPARSDRAPRRAGADGASPQSIP